MSNRADLEFELTRIWQGERPVLSMLLWPLSLIYGTAAVLNRVLFATGLRKRTRLDAPVISVGNLVVGGAGKTPVTLEVARRLQAVGRKVAVLSRGYGRRSGDRVVVVSDGEAIRATADEGGDEPVWLARKLPGLIVTVARQRAEAATAALELGADILVLDDGFSHHALSRSVDMLVTDADGAFGNGRLLPSGPLREPIWSARRAQLIWVSRARDAVTPPGSLRTIPSVASSYRPTGLVNLDLTPAEGLDSLRGRRILGVCGIARPKSFESSLIETGAQVRDLLAFPDHHRFSPEDVRTIERAARDERCDFIITTEKDAMRLCEIMNHPLIRALRMELTLIGDAAPLEEILRPFARPQFLGDRL